jgi:hypothetical protein
VTIDFPGFTNLTVSGIPGEVVKIYDSNGKLLWKRKGEIQITFDVIDSKDESDVKRAFTLKLNGAVTTNYAMSDSGKVTMDVPKYGTFTLQVLEVDGYVDGATNTYTWSSLNGAHIGLTKIQVQDDTAEFKLNWDISVVPDLDTHMVVKSGSTELGHVMYNNKSFSDSNTSVVLDVDNVSRSDKKPPEILTISKLNPDYTYYYYIDNFSKNGLMYKSGLTLNVILDNEEVDPPFSIPTDENSARYWNVCKVHGGEIIDAKSVLGETRTDSPNVTW